MGLLVLAVLALSVATGLADPDHSKNLPQKQADNAFLERQVKLSLLYYHIHEPIYDQEQSEIAKTWSIEKNIDHYNNVTAVRIFSEIHSQHGFLYRGMPFNFVDYVHAYQAKTLFQVLFSSKDYETFYKTAVWMREYINEYMFVYILNVATLHYPETQGIILPPIYEVFPSFFFNGVIMTEAQRINTQGFSELKKHYLAHIYDGHIVLKENLTYWPYENTEENKINYFTWDQGLNALYYNWFLTYPPWLGGEVAPLAKDRRGEWFWCIHQQLMARYYMERLSNGLGEIPELDWDVPVENGLTTGVLHQIGLPYPVRPNHFHMDKPEFVQIVDRIQDFERRLRDAIDLGYVIDHVGEHINIRTPEAIDVLGNIVQSNVDSPNHQFYGDFISLWKMLLGNSMQHTFYRADYNKHTPMVVPSFLEQYQTALRDPAFWMIWKRVLNIFSMWQEKLPVYRREELAVPSITIKSVEVDKLVTYFENSYVNITNHLYMNDHEAKTVSDDVSVLVERPRLNHKHFQIRVNVNSEAAKTVIVKFFLAPKYDGKGHQIPLAKNWHHFFLFDQFTYDLPQGETVIKRDPMQNRYFSDDWISGFDVFEKAEMSLHGKSAFMLDMNHRIDGFPCRLMLPKGRVGGMPFVLFVHISEYRAPKVPQGTGFDPTMSLGLGSGARYMTDEPMLYPLNKPIYDWQVRGLSNFWFQDVQIYHKPTPEIGSQHSY